MQKHRRIGSLICLTLSLSAAGCGDAWVNLTASLGGNTPGGRGSIGVIVLNNTLHQAVLTLGSYDQTSTDAELDFQQYVLDGGLALDADSDGGLLTFNCARVFSIGGPRLLSLIESTDPADVVQDALIEGVEFFAVDSANPDGAPVSQGLAAPFEVLLGVDFPCNSLLIFKLDVNEVGPDPFRIDFELIPSSNDR
jgi:hypothetical protein